MFFLEARGENPFACLFWLLEATHVPWLLAPSSILKASNLVSLICPFPDSPPSPSPTCQDPVITAAHADRVSREVRWQTALMPPVGLIPFAL